MILIEDLANDLVSEILYRARSENRKISRKWLRTSWEWAQNWYMNQQQLGITWDDSVDMFYKHVTVKEH